MKGRTSLTLVSVGVVGTLILAACGSSNGGSDGAGSNDPIKVGLVLTYTGAFATQAKDFENGFMAALDYRTKGSLTVAGHKIEVLKGDDTGDPAIGTAKAKEFLGEGAKVLAGPTVSSIAIAVAGQAAQNGALYLGGTAGTDALVGMDNKVFGTAGVTPAGSQVTKQILGSQANGKTIAVIGPNNVFGKNFAEQLTTLVKPLNVKVDNHLLPESTTDFTPLMLELKRDKPEFVTTSWFGAGLDQLFSALGSQGIPSQSTVFTNLALRASFAQIANALGDKALYFTAYFQGASGNDEEKALIAYSKKHKHVIEFDDAVGWNAGEMLVHAIQNGGVADADKMAETLKDWSFEGPGGQILIRGADNQVTVPNFTVHLAKQADGSWFPELVKAYSAKELEPPIVKPIPK